MRKNVLKRAVAIFLVFAAVFLTACSKEEKEKPEGLLLNGRELREYKIMLDSGSPYEKYTAEFLAESLAEETGYTVETVKEMPKSECAVILSDNGEDPTEALFSISLDSETVIRVSAPSYILAAGARYIADAISDGKEIGEATVKNEENVKWKPKKADSVILFIGDGMGLEHIKMSETEDASVVDAEGNVAKTSETAGKAFAAESFPNKGECVTLNYQGYITDSAAAATALATGNKTMNGTLGMIPADLNLDGEYNELQSVQNVREAAALAKKKTAILSTDRETGATPNAFLVHHSQRYDSTVVLEQQAALAETSVACDTLWCAYDSDEFYDEFTYALDSCASDSDGFFIMAEEAMIDKYASKSDYDNVIRSVKRLDSVVTYAVCYAVFSSDVALIVTADHETGGLSENEDGSFCWTSDGEHTDRNVGVFAIGGGTEIFNGTTVDNTDIAKFMFSVIENSKK